MSKWILKIAVFLTSSGEGPIVSKIDTRDDNRQKESGTPYDSQLLHRNVQRFRGGLVFKAHGLLYHSTLGLRVIKKKKKKKKKQKNGCASGFGSSTPRRPLISSFGFQVSRVSGH